MKQITKDPVLHFTAALVSGLKWTFWIGMGLCSLILVILLIAAAIGTSMVSEATDAVSFGAKDWAYTLILAFGSLLCFLFARFFKILRNVIDSVGLGSPLTAANAEQLIKMAKLLGTILVFGLLVDLGGVYWVPIETLCEDTAFDFYFNLITNFFLTLLSILLLVILARIFHLGAAMREELEGTV
jgi:hypothetical protein